MPMLIYIGALLGLLYYYGITQCFAQKVGWLMRISTGTTAVESTSVAANIFLNMVTFIMISLIQAVNTRNYENILYVYQRPNLLSLT